MVTGVEEPTVERKLSDEQMERREFLRIDEFLQTFAGAPKHQNVLVAQVVAEHIQKQIG